MWVQNSRRVIGSTPDVGSSRNSTSGRCISAHASARRCLKPSGIVSGDAFRYCFRSNRSIISSMRSRRSAPVRPYTPAIEIQILLHRQESVERELLRHVADLLFGLARRAAQVLSRDARLARGRLQQPAQHLERRRLAGPVRSEQPEDLAFADVKRHIVGRDEIAEALGQVPAGHCDVGAEVHRIHHLRDRRHGRRVRRRADPRTHPRSAALSARRRRRSCCATASSCATDAPSFNTTRTESP